MKHDLKTNNFERKVTRIYAILACTAMVMMVTEVPALAADDPLTVVNNLSEFIFSLIRHWPYPAGLRHPTGGPVSQEP